MAPAPVGADTYTGICNAYNCYVQSLDEGDFDGVVDCFTDEGVLMIDGRPARRGKAALRAQYDGRPAGRTETKHMVCGIWVRDEQDGVAHIVAALLLVSLQHGGIVGTGNSYDTLQKAADGSWRFVEKRVSLSWRTG